MKIFFKLLILLMNISCFAQCETLSVNQYNQILLNNHLISTIRNTHGVSNLVKPLFNESFTINSEVEPLTWIEYTSPSIELFFDDGEHNSMSGQMEYQLTIVNIKSPQYEVRFNDIIINVGDNVSVLGNNPPMIAYNDGRRSACYKIGSESLAFYLSRNNTITSIQYQYFN